MRQKKRFTEHEWILLEEKFNDLLPPILGYAEFLQMQLGKGEIQPNHKPGFQTPSACFVRPPQTMPRPREPLRKRADLSDTVISNEYSVQAEPGNSGPACITIKKLFFSSRQRGMIF